MTTEELLKNIRGTRKDRAIAIRYLTADEQLYMSIKQFVRNNKGDKDQVRMIFNDVIVAFTKYVFKNRSFVLSQSHRAYLYGMARNLWITELRKRKLSVVQLEVPDYFEEVDDVMPADELLIKVERRVILHSVLEKMRTRCKEVLMYWAGGYKMKEIAQLLGYQSEGMARKKKSECMKALYEYLGNNPSLVKELKAV